MQKLPTTIVICGITGDLSQKKILPALFEMYSNGEVGGDIRIVGFSRREMSQKDIFGFVEKSLVDFGAMGDKKKFLDKVSYVSGQFDDIEAYKKLSSHLQEIDKNNTGCSNKLFYFSIPPTLYETLATHISESGLAIPCGGVEGFARILIEKPFGNDIHTAEHLDSLLGKLFQEEQIFRIDHYLAKQSLFQIIENERLDKNLLDKWSDEYIKSVEINLFEKVTVGSRGPSYDSVGAFRDVGQNHMLQMLSLIVMDIPVEKTAKNIQKARAEVLESLVIPRSDQIQNMHRGQYNGYLHEPGVDKHSLTETFFSIFVFLERNNFTGVPFVLTSGKAMEKSLTEIVINFKDDARVVFNIPATDSLPAYQKILLDCISGDQTVFTSTREVLAEWRFVTPIVESWQNKVPFLYDIGSSVSDLRKKSDF